MQMSPRSEEAKAAAASQARTPLRRKQSRLGKLKLEAVTNQGVQILVTRRTMQTVADESARIPLRSHGAGVLVLDAAEAEVPRLAGNVRNASARLLRQNESGQQ